MSDSPRLVPDPPASAARFGDGGDYYWPGLATREPELVLAAWFFLAAEEELPEIRASLRSEVYERLPEDRTDVYLWRNEEDRWKLYENDWAPPSWAVPPAGSSRETHPMLEGVLALRAWVCRFRLTSHPLIEVAVDILIGWQEDEIAVREDRKPLPVLAWHRLGTRGLSRARRTSSASRSHESARPNRPEPAHPKTDAPAPPEKIPGASV